MASKIGRIVTYFERLLTIQSFYALITWSCKVTWQTKIIIYPQLECLWLQTSQNDDLSCWVPTYKITSPFDHVVLQGHVTKNHYISITKVPMATKLGRMMTSIDELLPIMLHDPLITWHCEIRISLTGGGSARKHLSRHRLLVYLKTIIPLFCDSVLSHHLLWKQLFLKYS